MRDYKARAIAIINAGQAIKSHIKDATDDLNRAYYQIKNDVQDQLLKLPKDNEVDDLYYGFPDLHNFKEKHVDLINALLPDYDVQPILDLVELRKEVRAVEIVKRVPKENPEADIKAQVLNSFEKANADARRTFDWSVRIINAFHEIVGGDNIKIPVSVNPVYCQNYAGTNWIRIDWYLAGRKVPFNTIMAAVQEVMK